MWTWYPRSAASILSGRELSLTHPSHGDAFEQRLVTFLRCLGRTRLVRHHVNDGTRPGDTFKLQTNGVYTCPEFFREGTLSNGISGSRLPTRLLGIQSLRRHGHAGKLAHIVDRNGNTVSLAYAAGQLTQIVDDLDRH